MHYTCKEQKYGPDDLFTSLGRDERGLTVQPSFNWDCFTLSLNLQSGRVVVLEQSAGNFMDNLTWKMKGLVPVAAASALRKTFGISSSTSTFATKPDMASSTVMDAFA